MGGVDARVAREVVVRGRVQGVFFRDSCRREAQARDLAGWVGNEPDGSVRLHVEGAPTAVDELVAWARQGPPRAEVESVDMADVEPEGLSAFQVR